MYKQLLFSLLVGVSVQAGRPNVLFILVDDLGYSDVACYGNTLHETPNVDRLAREGMRFTAAYTACAVCSPTRASIQTGQYPIRFGITDWIAGARKPNTPLKEQWTKRMLPLEAVTVAEAFKGQGYKTAFVGKWHLNDHDHTTGFPEDQGYDVNIGGHHKGSPPGGYFAPFKNPKMDDRPDDLYLTDRLGDEAIGLIESHAGGSDPFFLMLAFYTVHTPIQPKPELQRHYEKKLAKQPAGHWNNPKYAAMVHSMDENVGRVLDALDRQGMANDTIVVFFSDNGGLSRQTSCWPLSRGKGFYHEGGIRVPLIVRMPGTVKPGSETDEPVISNDLFPTLLDLAGLPLRPDAHKDGLSLKPLLETQRFKSHDLLCWHYPHYHGAGETPASAIRMGDFKFIRHYEDATRELYNLKEDIGEADNLVDKMPEMADKYEAALDRWLSQREAYIPKADPGFDPSKPVGKKR
ncbi:Arylsulfatase [Pontiella desulfatans]|uniref:Arylsulfatase n=1 Tax=Pontiella desulfatans TaxID=2750659 RepID=A0A6C2TW27_PONDE|nr:sulfatase [Pontiella desulfatans]SPS73605.1 sulfatase S1_16 [Kiritimatiellales bacterium]VGO11704.1 Arylsulfatase [Pontiella desulfatans]